MEEGKQEHDVGSEPAEPTRETKRQVKRSWLRAFTASLAVLDLLILAGFITRYVSVILANEQLQSRSNSHNDFLVSYKALSENYSELLDEVKKLKHQINEAKSFPGGWKRFGSSFYLKSSEKKSWFVSRIDCQNRGSDLVVINSREEQDFVTSLSVNEQFWIGLKREWNQTDSKYEWTWVDGSAVTQTFSLTGNIEPCKGWCYAVYCDRDGRWKSGYDTTTRKWMCEKPIDIVN